MYLFNSILTIWFFIVISEHIATIGKSDKKIKRTNEQEFKLNLFDIYDSINIDGEITEKCLKYSKELQHIKSFINGSTLAYVTPWNNYGYDIAKKFTNKFSFISPVWLAISYDGNDFQITGSRDIDIKWIMDLKSRNSQLKLVPRLLFENWNTANFIHVIQNEYIISKCIDTITQFLMKYNFDGVVLEMWLQVGAYSKTDSYHFLTHFGQEMKNKNLIFILAISPPIYIGNYEGLFNHYDYLQLSNFVDFFSLMTYDYSNSQNPGPNAPLGWMKKCVEIIEPNDDKSFRSRILLGLNFYGYLYSRTESKPIIRHEFMDLIKSAQSVNVIWHKDSKEHEFRIKNADRSELSVWYPTFESVSLRIRLAESLGVGISIWEIGQGLDYFYDAL